MKENPSYLHDLDQLDNIEFAKQRKTPRRYDAIPLKDMVGNRKGTVQRLIPVEPKDQDINLSWKVEYIPAQTHLKSMTTYLKMFFGLTTSKITEDQFPDKAVKEINIDKGYPGIQDKEIALLENEDGERDVAEQLELEVDQSISDAERREGKALSEKKLEEVMNEASEGGKRAAGEKESPSRSSRREENPRDRKDRRRSGRSRRKR